MPPGQRRRLLRRSPVLDPQGRGALVASGLPIIEVHISNVFARESFRHHSYISGVAVGVIAGLGTRGYEVGLEALLVHLDR